RSRAGPHTPLRTPYTSRNLPMKTKLTVTIDRDLIPKAKQRARVECMSLSRLIERALTALTSQEETSFAERWRGRFRAANRKDQKRDLGGDVGVARTRVTRARALRRGSGGSRPARTG